MGLIKTKTFPNKSNIPSGEYWKIDWLEVDYRNLRVNYKISLYLDKEHADSGFPNLGRSYGFSGKFTKNQLKGDLRLLGYMELKTQLTSPPPSVDRLKMARLDLTGAVDLL